MQLANRTEEVDGRGDLACRNTEALSEDNRVTQEDSSQKSGRRKGDDNSLPKKFKARFACKECRERKIRCDGAHPECGPCRQRHRVRRKCVYLTDGTNVFSAEYVAKLQDKIRELENSKPSSSDISSFSGEPNQETEPLKLTSNDAYNGQNGEPSHELIFKYEEKVNSLGSMGMNEDNHEGSSNSSIASFIQHVRDAVGARYSLPKQQVALISSMPSLPHQSRLSSAEIFVLPARNAVDGMMKTYWNQVHVLYPIIHRPSFERLYQSLWAANETRSDDSRVYSILNIIFAICCQLYKADMNDERGMDADVYFRRAMQLLQVDFIGSASIELIQALLLVGIYLQSTEWPHKCYVVVGLAIRTAQGMGLHLPRTSVSMEQLDREVTRRVWHGCVFMDRLVSMTLGRPTVISKTDALNVPLPKSIDDEDLSVASESDRGLQLDNKPSITEFYVQSLKLYIIQEEILSVFYSTDRKAYLPPMQRLEDLNFDAILRADSSLRRWRDSLPDFIEICGGISDEMDRTVFSRQANILHLRFLQAQILLFRPVICLLLTQEIRSNIPQSPDPQLPLSQALALLCARKCTLSAQALINIVYDCEIMIQHPSDTKPLPAWWWTAFFIYTAAIALIPARAYTHIRGDITLASLNEAWRRSVSILGQLSSFSFSASRCSTVLQKLNEAIVPKTQTDATGDIAHAGLKANECVSDHGHPAMGSTAAGPPVGTNFSREMASMALPPRTMLMDEAYFFGHSADLKMQGVSWFDSLPEDLLAIEDDGIFSWPQLGRGDIPKS